MPQYIVRYGSLRLMGVFSTSRHNSFLRDAKVIARTARGLELGDVLCEATERAVQDLSDSTGGQILRHLTKEDRHELSRIRDQERKIWELQNSSFPKILTWTTPLKPSHPTANELTPISPPS